MKAAELQMEDGSTDDVVQSQKLLTFLKGMFGSYSILLVTAPIPQPPLGATAGQQDIASAVQLFTMIVGALRTKVSDDLIT